MGARAGAVSGAGVSAGAGASWGRASSTGIGDGAGLAMSGPAPSSTKALTGAS
jgi:hypothetical protein